MRIYCLGIALALVACAKNGGPGQPPEKQRSSSETQEPDASRPRVKGHRGASITAPENTLTAVRLAFERGADACEIDVRLTKDGAIVMYHDEDTERIGGRPGLVREQTLAQLRDLDLGSWKNPAYAEERIATLGQVLDELPAGKILFVEIKDGVEAVPGVVAAITAASPKGEVAIESFSPEVLRAVAAAAPKLSLHLTLGAKEDASGRVLPLALSQVQSAKAAGFHGLSVDVRGLRAAFAEAAKAQGLELAVWTVNSVELLESLQELPITWIETDAPGLISEALRSPAKSE